jgi:hypothetical protein
MKRPRPARAWWCALCIALCGCDALAPKPFCQLGAEHEVARMTAKVLDAIDVVVLADRAVSLWSEPAGLFARTLSRDGVPRGAAQRLGPRCDGGLDARADGDGVLLACSTHPLRDRPEIESGVAVLRVRSDLSVGARRWIAPAGDLSEGVALARAAHGFELAWHDGSPIAQRVWWTRLGADLAPQAPLAVSDASRVASSPAMAVDAGKSVLGWTEMWVARGELQGRIALWDHGRSTRTLRSVAHAGAMPQLLMLGDQLLLGFRDVRPSIKTGLYLGRVFGHGARMSEPARVGRADGVGKPALEPCMNGVVAATPRTYGGDYFVGVNWLDGALRKARGEQQFYEDSRAFTQVAVACGGGHALLFIAEFPQLLRDSSALRAVPYQCR